MYTFPNLLENEAIVAADVYVKVDVVSISLGSENSIRGKPSCSRTMAPLYHTLLQFHCFTCKVWF